MGIDYYQFENRNDLINQLEKEKKKPIILFDKTDFPKNYYLLKIEGNNINEVVGIISENPFMPNCLVVNDIVLLGFNSEAVFIHGGIVYRVHKSNSCFYEFIRLEQYILAIFEIDAVCIDLNGKKIWDYYAGGIIEQYCADDTNLYLIVDDKKVKISIASGEKTFV